MKQYMKGAGTLEVLIVDAEDIRHTNVLGKTAAHYVRLKLINLGHNSVLYISEIVL